MEEKNFRSFMEFLKFLESEDLKGTSPKDAITGLAAAAEQELTEEQRLEFGQEFPALVKGRDASGSTEPAGSPR